MFVFCDGYSRDYQSSPNKVPLSVYPLNDQDNEILVTEEFEIL